jgi:hypothetical protein
MLHQALFRYRAQMLDSKRFEIEFEVLFDPFSFKKKDDNFKIPALG